VNVELPTPFCRTFRENPAGDAACVACDREHLRLMKENGRMHIYQCHQGPIEGLIPLFDLKGGYFGALCFGQMRKPYAQPPALQGRRLTDLYNKLPAYSMRQASDIAELLDYFAKYMLQNELVKYAGTRWSEAMKQHIGDHIGEKLSVRTLARVSGRSVSYITHRFRAEFGMPPTRYIRDLKIEAARKKLLAGELVKTVAYELGFANEFHFSKVFKSRFGVSPSACRAQNDSAR